MIDTRVDNSNETVENNQSTENMTPEANDTSSIASTTQKLLACTNVNTASSTPAAVLAKQNS